MMITGTKSSPSSRSSASQYQEVEVEEDELNKKPVWLDSFLKKTFFTPCAVHDQLRRNEMNSYCVSCDASACQYCVSIGPHKKHRLLKIYRHVYKDVVSLGSMGRYMDCTNIQPYKCNKSLILALHPLPHCGLPIHSDKRCCTVCNRRLNEVHCHFYCSIACKVKAFPHVMGGTGGGPNESDESEEEEEEEEEKEAARPSCCSKTKKSRHEEKQVRKRKGIPQRAPLF